SSVSALVYYDYTLTFPREVQYIWKQKFRLSTALYIGCRYAMVANVLYLLAITNKLGHTVRFLVQNRGRFKRPWAPLRNWSVALKLAHIPVLTIFCTVVFTLRSSAVYGRNMWIAAYMSVVGLACIAMAITHIPGLRCSGTAAIPLYAQSTSRSASALIDMVSIEDFGPDPVALAAANGTNRAEIQLKDVLHDVPENGGDDHCAVGLPCLPKLENEAV
ncbi:hypothetical protein C8R45DRAFT_830356, partial [Mycena sanguinolenta]